MSAEWWEKYRHVPFKEHGRDFEGADCWGFIRLILQEEKGSEIPSYDEMYKDSYQSREINAAVEQVKSNGFWQDVEKPEPFDVVLLKESAAGVICHVGLVIRPGFMIHLRRNKGVVIQPIRCMEYKNRMMGFVRYVSN